MHVGKHIYVCCLSMKKMCKDILHCQESRFRKVIRLIFFFVLFILLCLYQ